MIVNIRNILVPTDLSEACDKALDYASQLATVFNATLHLLHVIEMPVVADPMPGSLMWPYPSAAVVDEARRCLEDLQKRVSVPSTVSVERGVASESILAYAKENAIDLIVMATHGRRGFARMLVGSTTETVLRRAPCPVISIRPEKAVQPPESAPAEAEKKKAET
ncbi:MAG: universal stress protein [Proteobacteria bacterium]|nr:universal stress protein [Pseudomonadota bacterium]